MESSEPASADPKAPGMQPQRHISGMLLLSLFLSIGGLIVIPVIGGLGGLVFAVIGRRRVLKDPLLIGPTFAMICIVVAAVSIPLQGWRVWQTLPQLGYLQSMGDLRTGFFAHVENRDWQGVFDSMHAEYRQTHSPQDVEAVLGAVFPGSEKIQLTEENLKFHQFEGEEERKKESERFMKFLDGVDDQKIFDFDLTCSVLFPDEEEQVDLHLRIRVHRESYMKFQSRVLDFEAQRVPLVKEEPVTSGQSGDGKMDEGAENDPGHESGKAPDGE